MDRSLTARSRRWSHALLVAATLLAPVDAALAAPSSSTPPVARLPDTGPGTPWGRPTIRFARGRAAIPRSARALLRDAVSTMQSYPELTVRVEGHRARGEHATLGLRRAAAVKAALVAAGIAQARLTVADRGDCCPLYPRGKRTAYDRRVEFVIVTDH